MVTWDRSTHRSEWLQRYTPLQNPITIRFGNNGVMQALGKCQLTFHLPGRRKLHHQWWCVWHAWYHQEPSLNKSKRLRMERSLSSIITGSWFIISTPNGLTLRISCKRKGWVKYDQCTSNSPIENRSSRNREIEKQTQTHIALALWTRTSTSCCYAIRTLQTRSKHLCSRSPKVKRFAGSYA